MLDWRDNIQKKNVRKSEVELHETLHKQRAQQDVRELLQNKRLRLIPFAEKIIHQKIQGKVLDLGAGSGYLSAWLDINRDMEEVLALECTEAAVYDLIPKVIETSGASPQTVKPVIGSFTDIPLKNYFDYIIAFGALHHSKNLFRTLNQCFLSLKPGGYVIAQEPTFKDDKSNQFFIDKYMTEEVFAGKKILKNERDDHFFRLCEYKVATYHNGFDIVYARSISNRWLYARFKSLVKRMLNGNVTKNTHPSSYLFILQKPLHPMPFIPHTFEV